MIMLARPDLRRTADGDVHKAVWQPACLCIPLLRPHRHQRVPEWFVAARAGSLLFPRCRRCSGGRQDCPESTHRTVPELGGGLRRQSPASHRVGREGRAQGGLRAPHLRRIVKSNTYGVYFIFKSMEQGSTFRISVPKFPTQDPNHRILARQRSRFTHYYFYVRDEVLGPIILRVASFFPFHATYWLNGHSFIEQELKRVHIGFRKNDNAF